MRGEDALRSPPRCIVPETPPHAWGRRLHQLAVTPVHGNTPTCVGKTTAASGLWGSAQKHPHMRGEDNTSNALLSSLRETPPHAWGRLNHAHTELSHGGNTPTCVGKTLNFWVGFQPTRKHPHMRGEDFTAARQRIEDLETPPHAWGRREQGTRGRKVHRNTPTCVGKTGCRTRSSSSPRKHPHMRGEDHAPHTPRNSSCGNTPTCVGKT